MVYQVGQESWSSASGYNLQMSDDILSGGQKCRQVALYIIQIDWAQGLSPEGHSAGGEMAQISSRLQRQFDPYQTDKAESTTKLCS